LPVVSLSRPVHLYLDFDAGTVDAIVSRLTRLRLQILPPPEQHQRQPPTEGLANCFIRGVR